MKQLLLYFLFFVGFALILVQCAKLFPTSNKSLPNPSRVKVTNSKPAQPQKTAVNIIHTVGDYYGWKPGAGVSSFYDSFSPYSILARINGSLALYNPEVIFKHYSFASNFNEKSLQDKKY